VGLAGLQFVNELGDFGFVVGAAEEIGDGHEGPFGGVLAGGDVGPISVI